MKRDSIAWERAAEVREAATGWFRAGAIDRPTHEAIGSAYSLHALANVETKTKTTKKEAKQ